MTEETQDVRIEELARRIEDGEPIDDIQLCTRLKRDGLDLNQRVGFLERLYERTKDSIRRNIEKMRKNFEEDPSLREEYSRRYRAWDFVLVPAIGFFTNHSRAKHLKDKNYFYYEWANDSFKHRLAEKAFTAYHFAAVGLALVSIFECFNK